MVDQASNHLRIALAHDWLCGFRGGEAVLERIASLFPWPASDARTIDEILASADVRPRLFTLFDDGRPLSRRIDSIPRRASILNRAPASWRRWLLPLYPAGVRDLSGRLRAAHDRRPFDALVSTSSGLVKGLRAPPGVPHICYCHSPARYLWSQTDQYTPATAAGRLRAAGFSAFGPFLRRWDRATAAHVDVFLANSCHTAALIRLAFGRPSRVIHPPCRTEFFTPSRIPREGFWLCVGALEPYKRIDLAIRAGEFAGRELVIVGEGSERAALGRLAGPRVRFLGRIPDEELRDWYRRAEVLLYPQVEDFGITAVEAQACGLGVIARRAGGALDTVVEGRTGAFFDEPTPEALAAAARTAPAFDAAECRRNALRFAEVEFDRAMLAAVRACRSSCG